MEEYERIAAIQDEQQAQLVETALTERGIPHVLVSYHDSAYDGVFQSQTAWGHVEGPADRSRDILQIVQDLRAEE